MNVLIGFFLFTSSCNSDIQVTQALQTEFLQAQPKEFPARWENAPIEHYTQQYAWEEYQQGLDQSIETYRIVKDDDYCEKRKAYVASRTVRYGPDGLPLKEDRHAFTQYTSEYPIFKEFRKYLTLDLPNQVINRNMKPMPASTDIVFSVYSTFHRAHELGKHFLCDSSQRYGMVPGSNRMAYKDEIIEMAKSYGDYFAGREHCYTPWDFFPKTYIMWEPEDCKEILNILAQQETDDIQYMGKVARASHRGKGISILTLDEIQKLQVKYDYGRKCDEEQTDKYIIQKYIPKPLLINGRKMDFRCYMVIASTEPLIVFYQDGLIRLAHDEFDEHSTDKGAHLTNLSVAKKEHGDDQTEEEAMAEAAWTMQQFQDYLVANGIVDEEWFEEVMVPKMKSIIMHTVRSVSERLLRHPDVFEMLGVDFLLDADLNLWLMEVTPNPQSQAATPEIGEMKNKMWKDLLSMQYALIDDNWDVFDKIQGQSSFQYVYDGRKKGMDRYHGILSEDCV